MSESIALVMQYERKQGRNPIDVSKKYIGYDIKSDDRLIEVKKRDIKYGFLYVTKNEFLTFQKNKNAYLYLVYYEDGKPARAPSTRGSIGINFSLKPDNRSISSRIFFAHLLPQFVRSFSEPSTMRKTIGDFDLLNLHNLFDIHSFKFSNA